LWIPKLYVPKRDEVKEDKKTGDAHSTSYNLVGRKSAHLFGNIASSLLVFIGFDDTRDGREEKG
jgi:hypothetical protein